MVKIRIKYEGKGQEKKKDIRTIGMILVKCIHYIIYDFMYIYRERESEKVRENEKERVGERERESGREIESGREKKRGRENESERER